MVTKNRMYCRNGFASQTSRYGQPHPQVYTPDWPLRSHSKTFALAIGLGITFEPDGVTMTLYSDLHDSAICFLSFVKSPTPSSHQKDPSLQPVSGYHHP